MNKEPKMHTKLAILIFVLLSGSLTLGYVLGHGDFHGSSLAAYIFLLIGCLALAISIALDDSK